QCLREPTGARGLLPDAPALQGPGLVLIAGGLAPDAELEQHRRGIGDAGIDVVGRRDDGGGSLSGQDAAREARDQVATLGGRIDEDELADRQHVTQPGQTVDQLGRVGRATSDDGEPHPFTPVSVTPSMKAFCAKKNTMMTGAITSKVAAIVRFQSVW